MGQRRNEKYVYLVQHMLMVVTNIMKYEGTELSNKYILNKSYITVKVKNEANLLLRLYFQNTWMLKGETQKKLDICKFCFRSTQPWKGSVKSRNCYKNCPWRSSPETNY